MRAFILGLAGILLSAVTASAGGNSPGFAAGFGNALPQAQAQPLCGSPSAPAWCAPPPVYASPPTYPAAPTCITLPVDRGAAGIAYIQRCY